MKASIGFRLVSVILTAIMFIATFNFPLTPVRAGSDAEEAVKKAKEAVEQAKAAEEAAKKAADAAAEAAKKAKPLQNASNPPDEETEQQAADRIAKEADDAAKAADDAKDNLKKARDEAAAAAAAVAKPGATEQDKQNANDARLREAEAEGTEIRTEAEAAKKEKESDEADRLARLADKKRRLADKKPLNDAQVNTIAAARAARKRARKARRDARAARRAAEQALQEAEKAVAQQAARVGGNQSAAQGLKDELAGLKKTLGSFSIAENSPPGNFISQSNFIPQEMGSGVQVGEFNVPPGKITVTLPDDIRAGDTISGTVSVEPNGQTPEEKANNRRKLGDFMIMVPFRPVPPDPKIDDNPNILRSGNLTGIVIDPKGPATVGAGFYIQDPEPDKNPSTSEGVFVFGPLPASPLGGVVTNPNPVTGPKTVPPAPPTFDLKLYQLPNQDSPLGPCGRSGSIVTINEGCKPISQLVFTPPTIPPIVIDPPAADPIFTVPALGQNGRPVVIFGPFDGNSSNTGVNVLPVPPSTQGTTCPIIAETPRQAVFIAPPDTTGPMQVTVKDGDKQTTAPFRNVGVQLTAPKTSLMKGEQTQLTIQVTGLQGITAPVPLTLTCTGVITMQGGTYQPLMIQPSQVGNDGRYTTTRDITGVQAGGWGATATVVTGRFNACMRDDSVPSIVILWNTVSGDYSFTHFTPLTSPVQQPPPVTSLTGTGKITMKGCIITLTHNAPDRRVTANLDPCNKIGDASVQVESPKVNFTIRHRNITDSGPCQ